jgi:LacI family transcriptional regulator
MAATIKDIAKAAGVSRGTVDRVLHGRRGVNPDVAHRIRELADGMDFVPNKAGKILASRKQPVKIGCLLPSIGNCFFNDVIEGIRLAESELADFGVSVHIEEVKGYEPEIHVTGIRTLLADGCAALCVSTLDIPEIRTVIDTVIEDGIPVIAVNTDITGTNRLCYVGCNYYKGGSTAAKLLSLIFRHELNILIFTGSLKMKGHNERIQGFLEGLTAQAIPYGVVDIFESNDDDEYVYKPALRLLQENPTINCIYIVTACISGVCRAVSELGREKQIHILTFDDVPSTRALVQNGIIDFTICQEPVQQGYRSIQMMFSYFMSNRKIMPVDSLTDTIIKISENVE